MKLVLALCVAGCSHAPTEPVSIRTALPTTEQQSAERKAAYCEAVRSHPVQVHYILSFDRPFRADGDVLETEQAREQVREGLAAIGAKAITEGTQNALKLFLTVTSQSFNGPLLDDKELKLASQIFQTDTLALCPVRSETPSTHTTEPAASSLTATTSTATPPAQDHDDDSGAATTTTSQAQTQTSSTNPIGTSECGSDNEDIALAVLDYASTIRPTLSAEISTIARSTSDNSWARADASFENEESFLAIAHCINDQWVVVDAGTNDVGCGTVAPYAVLNELGLEC